MLRLANAQVLKLESSREEDFVASLSDDLGTDFPDKISDLGLKRVPDLRDFVRKGIARARGHGIAYEEDLILFAECRILLGPDFDRALDWARAILERDDLSGDDKMDLIDEHMMFGGPVPL